MSEGRQAFLPRDVAEAFRGSVGKLPGALLTPGFIWQVPTNAGTVQIEPHADGVVVQLPAGAMRAPEQWYGLGTPGPTGKILVRPRDGRSIDDVGQRIVATLARKPPKDPIRVASSDLPEKLTSSIGALPGVARTSRGWRVPTTHGVVLVTPRNEKLMVVRFEEPRRIDELAKRAFHRLGVDGVKGYSVPEDGANLEVLGRKAAASLAQLAPPPSMRLRRPQDVDAISSDLARDPKRVREMILAAGWVILTDAPFTLTTGLTLRQFWVWAPGHGEGIFTPQLSPDSVERHADRGRLLSVYGWHPQKLGTFARNIAMNDRETVFRLRWESAHLLQLPQLPGKSELTRPLLEELFIEAANRAERAIESIPEEMLDAHERAFFESKIASLRGIRSNFTRRPPAGSVVPPLPDGTLKSAHFDADQLARRAWARGGEIPGFVGAGNHLAMRVMPKIRLWDPNDGIDAPPHFVEGQRVIEAMHMANNGIVPTWRVASVILVPGQRPAYHLVPEHLVVEAEGSGYRPRVEVEENLWPAPIPRADQGVLGKDSAGASGAAATPPSIDEARRIVLARRTAPPPVEKPPSEKLPDGAVRLEKECGCVTHEGPHWLHEDELFRQSNRRFLEGARAGDPSSVQALAIEEINRLREKRFQMQRLGIQAVCADCGIGFKRLPAQCLCGKTFGDTKAAVAPRPAPSLDPRAGTDGYKLVAAGNGTWGLVDKATGVRLKGAADRPTVLRARDRLVQAAALAARFHRSK